MDINSLNREELKTLLKKLKLLRNLKNSLGKRGVNKFNLIESGKSDLVVEHVGAVSEKQALEKALEIYKIYFNLKPAKKDITFKVMDSIIGGIRVYKDDNLVDLSFSRIEKKL